MKKTAKRRRSKQQVIADRENARRQEALVQAKLAKYDALEQEHRSLAKRVKQEDLIQNQVNSLYHAGILSEDKNGNLVVAQQLTLEEFQECEKDDEEMADHDPRRKQKRYNDFDQKSIAAGQQDDGGSALDNRQQ